MSTVWPSKMLTLVVTLRVLKIGWLMTFGVMTVCVLPIWTPAALNAGDAVVIGLP